MAKEKGPQRSAVCLGVSNLFRKPAIFDLPGLPAKRPVEQEQEQGKLVDNTKRHNQPDGDNNRD